MSKLGWIIRICIFLFLVYCFGVYDYFNWDVLCAQDAEGKIDTLIFQWIYFMVIYFILDILLVEIPQILFDIEL